jgi:hypothetical protein
MRIPYLRFFLCSDDVKMIMENPGYSSRLSSADREKLECDIQNSNNRGRRSHAILGQVIMKQYSSIRFQQIEFFVDAQTYDIPSWSFMKVHTLSIIQQIKLPESFDNWEDDDNVGLDANEIGVDEEDECETDDVDFSR